MTDNSNQIPNLHNNDASVFQNPIEFKTHKGSFGSLSKLMIGSLAIGIDELNYRLKMWEEKTRPHRVEDDLDSIPIQDNGSPKTSNILPYVINDGELQQNEMRYIMIGLINETQSRLVSTTHKLIRIGNRINRISYPIIKPFNRNWLIPPLQKRYADLIERGENELNRLSLVGRSEYEQSRRMAQIAYEDSFEEAVDSLATNPEVQNLIQSQGMSMAEEIIEEVRERAVSADNLLDRIVRNIFRRKSRSQIPPPSFVIK